MGTQTWNQPSAKITSHQRVLQWFKAIKHAQVAQVKSMLKQYPNLIRSKIVETIPYPSSIPSKIRHILGEDTHNLTGLHYSLLYLIAEQSKKADRLETSKTFAARGYIAALLIEHSTSSDINNLHWGFSNTALHLAALTGDDSILYKMLNKGGEPRISNHFGITPFDIIYNTRRSQATWIHNGVHEDSPYLSTDPINRNGDEFTERRGRSRQCKPLNETVKYVDERFGVESTTNFNRAFY